VSLYEGVNGSLNEGVFRRCLCTYGLSSYVSLCNWIMDSDVSHGCAFTLLARLS
jgi:hypothetical protein